MNPITLSIAGSDPSGGAGIQADLKVFHQFQTIGWAVPSLLTIQNSRGIRDIIGLGGEEVAAQLSAILDDATPIAVKTGALGSPDVVKRVSSLLRPLNTKLIIDPVFISSSGHQLLSDDGIRTLVDELIPQCLLITPNIPEASALTNIPIDSEASLSEALHALREMGAGNVLITGGHAIGHEKTRAKDVLLDLDGTKVFESPMQTSESTHGTGCALSAAITALLAHETPLREAIATAKCYLDRAIETGLPPLRGDGKGILNYHSTTALS